MEKMEKLNFLFNEIELKVYGDVDNQIFVIDDICEIIGLKKYSDLIRRVKKDEFFRMGLTNRPQIPQCGGQQLAIVNEFGLYEILFGYDSQISSQFRREINIWLKEQRIQQNIIQRQKTLQLKQLQKEIKKTNKMSREYNHRIIQFLDKRDGKLLYVIHFHEKYRIQKVQKIVHYLIGIGYNICDIDQINDLNHYRICDVREIISEMTKIH